MRSNKMKTFVAAAVVALGFAVSGDAAAQGMSKDKMDKMHKMDKMSQPMMDKMMSGWPAASREAVMFMSKKYGPPAAMTAEMAVWGKTGPWKRTVVFGQEYAHDFPMPHTDVMQQWVDYKAPASMYDELAMYDGSVVLERTSGEISARCDKEAANFLALNLAHDVVTGKQSVEGARMMYGDQIMKMKAMQPAPYTEKLLFSMMSNTADKDKPLMK